MEKNSWIQVQLINPCQNSVMHSTIPDVYCFHSAVWDVHRENFHFWSSLCICGFVQEHSGQKLVFPNFASFWIYQWCIQTKNSIAWRISSYPRSEINNCKSIPSPTSDRQYIHKKKTLTDGSILRGNDVNDVCILPSIDVGKAN